MTPINHTLFGRVAPRRWYAVWWDAWWHPAGSGFQRALGEQDGSPSRPLRWISLSIAALIIARAFYVPPTLFVIFRVLGAAILGVAGLGVLSAVYHLIARKLKGRGSWSEDFFCLSAISAPYFLFTAVFTVLNHLVPKLFGPALFIIVDVYFLILNVAAIRTSEKIGSGRALVIFLASAVAALVLLFLLNGIFSIYDIVFY